MATNQEYMTILEGKVTEKQFALISACMYLHDREVTADVIVTAAKTFETYLSGEEKVDEEFARPDTFDVAVATPVI